MTNNEMSGLRLKSGKLSSLLGPKKEENASGPIKIELSKIDEDAGQPRTSNNPGFSKESIRELAQTIKERGVKTPISVRINPENPERFVINHGARRYRASQAAGMTTIPAFIDDDYSEADQVIENIQRDGLTAREIADFIGRQKSSGKKGVDIAAMLGKSAAWVSQYSAILEMPEWMEGAFNEGKLTDVTLVNDILKFIKKNKKEEEVKEWFEAEEIISRNNFKLFCEFILNKDKISPTKNAGKEDSWNEDDIEYEHGKEKDEVLEKENKAANANEFSGIIENPSSQQIEEAKKKQKEAERDEKEEDSKKLKKAIIFGVYRDRIVRLRLSVRPDTVGFIAIKYEDDGEEAEVPAGDIKLTEIMEG